VASVVGVEGSQNVWERGEGVGVLEREADEFVEDRGAFPSCAVTVGEGSDAVAAFMVASWPAAAKWTAEVDARIKEPLPARRWSTW
jgi:hypothetical protein